MTITPEARETVCESEYWMRYADGGEPVTLYVQGSDLITGMDQKTGFRKTEYPERFINPMLIEKLCPGSIIMFKPEECFLVVEPSRSVMRENQSNSFYVKRIPVKELNQLKDEMGEKVKDVYIFGVGRMPLTEETVGKMKNYGFR